MKVAKILQIGNYPPPMCGWAIQLKLVTDELRRRGHVCEVLKLNQGRKTVSPEYVDVQSGPDYLRKIISFSLRGYRLNIHVNGSSKKGYWLALAAVLTGRLAGRPALLTFHGGLSQYYFPRHDGSVWSRAFSFLFRAAGAIACDSAEIASEIAAYGVAKTKIADIATFSPQYLEFQPGRLAEDIEGFLDRTQRVIFCYVAFRPEYRLETLREAMKNVRAQHPEMGFVWLGFPEPELIEARRYVDAWTLEERAGVLLVGNLIHPEFLTLLSRSFIYLRTPACDGVAASVLEALTLGVPVVASENGRRPQGVITYQDMSADDMVAKLNDVTERYGEVKRGLSAPASEDNVAKMAEWLVSGGRHGSPVT